MKEAVFPCLRFWPIRNRHRSIGIRATDGVCVSMTHTEIKATPRQEATFRCPCPRATAITLLQWSRRGLDPLFYRNLFQRQQPESFGDRVELKDGDLTLILKNVIISDNGTNKCRIVFRNKNSTERSFSASSSSQWGLGWVWIILLLLLLQNIQKMQKILLIFSC